MRDAISDTRKSRGRPKVGATQLAVRLPPDQLALLDRWIADQAEPLSRPEALRRLMIDALQRAGVG
jgi:hypothetical protein